MSMRIAGLLLTCALRARWGMQKDALRYLERNMAKLGLDAVPSNSSATSASDAAAETELMRRQLCGMHAMTAGQDVLVSIQLWMDVPGRLGCRQLCPMALGGGDAAAVPQEPVFQFVQGRKYFLAFFVQNRDLAYTKRLPFTDVIEVRLRRTTCAHRPSSTYLYLEICEVNPVRDLHAVALCSLRCRVAADPRGNASLRVLQVRMGVGEQGDQMHVKPQVRGVVVAAVVGRGAVAAVSVAGPGVSRCQRNKR